MNTRRRVLTGFAFFLVALMSVPGRISADDTPLAVTPGNILRFDLGPAEPPMPQVRFGDEWLVVANERNRWTVLLGVDIATVPGNYLLAVNHPSTDTLHFSVRARRDPILRRSTAETRSLESEGFVEAQLQRIQSGMVKKPEGAAQLPFWRPAPAARLLDRFGARQILPDGSFRPVRYLSFELASDTTVRAPANGKVLQVTEIGRARFVAVDHGQGLVSALWPLHETRVKTGDTLKQGTIIGINLVASGTRGEVNWALLMNRAWVHPLALVAEPETARPAPREAPASPPSKNTPAAKKSPRPGAIP